MEESINNETISKQKRFFKNIIIVLISNIISMLSGVLIGFIIPKIMGVSEYGYYKTFTLYSSYIGILHFGFIDGIYLKFAGKEYSEINKKQFRTYTQLLFMMEFSISLILLLASLFFLNTSYFLIILFVSINILVTNIVTYYEFISQITMRFKRTTVRSIIKSSLNILAVGILFLLFTYNNVVIYNYVYVAITLTISGFLALWYIISYREITFGRGIPLKEEKQNILFFFKIGIPLLLSNLIAQFIFIVDQQFVNLGFDNDTYSIYAFAYNMISLVTIATSAISVVLYPTLKTISSKSIERNYSKLNTYLLIFVALCIAAYFPLVFIVNNFLPQYNDSLLVFSIILPGIMFSSCISVVKYNCYKTFGKINNYFIKSLIVLVIAVIANLIVYFVFKDTKSISIVSMFVLFIWYVLAELYFIRTYHVAWIKNLIYIFLIAAGFYGTLFIPNIYIGFGVYLLFYAIVTVSMFYKIVKDILNRILGMFKSKKEKKMKVLVSGVAGQLGHDVINELNKNNIYAIGIDIKNEDEIANKANWNEYIRLDITNSFDVMTKVTDINPDVIIHCAAWTNVDGAEAEENKPLVKAINVDGTSNLVKIAKELDAKFLYISTDYVFDGEGEKPWEPDDKNYAPLNYYGKTKLDGELVVSSELEKYFIVRIAWVFGVNGKNFINTIYEVGKKHSEIRVVNDQIGTPTYTFDLARLLVDMIKTDKYGYYHATNEGGYISWYDFACEIFKQTGLSTKVNPVTTEEYGISIAKRPHNSRLDKSKLVENGFEPLPDWKDAVNRYLKETNKI